MTPQQKVQHLISSNKIEEAINALYEVPGINTNDAIHLQSRWNGHKRNQILGMLSFSEASQEQAKIVSALLSYAGCDQSTMVATKPTYLTQSAPNWESALLQIIKDNDRKNQDAAKKALTLLESFRTYYDNKRTRAFFDRSGDKLKEIETSFESFKATLNKSENESVEKFIDRVASLIDSSVPDWPSISDAYTLCVGRGFSDSYVERNLSATPNDDDAKLKAVQSIENFLGSL